MASQHSERALMLVDGQPQRVNLGSQQWQYYTISVGDANADLTVTVTPSFGDPDLYVLADGTDDMPTRTHYGWSSTAPGGDELTISHTDENFCTGCTYRIGVYAWSQSNMTIIASTGRATTVLSDGDPLRTSVEA